MALPAYDTEALIANIKRRASVPTSQLTFTDQDFVDLANDELQGDVVPLIMSTRAEYFVDHYDTVSPASGIIPFPGATVGNKVRSVCYKMQESPLTLINLPQINLDTVAGVGFTNYNTFTGFYIEGNNLCLYPNTAVPTNTTIRIYYYKRTLVLAAPDFYGKILSIDAGTNSVVLDYVPAAWAAATVLNAVESISPFNITTDAVTIASVSSPTVFLDDVTDLSVGDYLSEEGYSPVPQVPVEAHAYLAQMTAAKCLEALGDINGMKSAEIKAEKLKQSLLVMISNRVDGSPKKIMSGSGGLRTGASLGRFGRGAY